jgi:RimJ/RimL family protein N-acetyltransferase
MADRRPSPVTLIGRHVRLEPLAPSHAAGLADAAGERRDTYGYTTVPDGLAGAAAYVTTAQGNLDQVAFATVRLPDETIVGSTRFLTIQYWTSDSPFPESCEIGGTWLAASAQRSAVNTESKLLLLTHAFETWGCLRVQLKTDARNQRSWAAIERIGATFEGVLRNYQLAQPGPGPRDSAMFSITPDEWPAVKAGLQQRLES